MFLFCCGCLGILMKWDRMILVLLFMELLSLSVLILLSLVYSSFYLFFVIIVLCSASIFSYLLIVVSSVLFGKDSSSNFVF